MARQRRSPEATTFGPATHRDTACFQKRASSVATKSYVSTFLTGFCQRRAALLRPATFGVLSWLSVNAFEPHRGTGSRSRGTAMKTIQRQILRPAYLRAAMPLTCYLKEWLSSHMPAIQDYLTAFGQSLSRSHFGTGSRRHVLAIRVPDSLSKIEQRSDDELHRERRSPGWRRLHFARCRSVAKADSGNATSAQR